MKIRINPSKARLLEDHNYNTSKLAMFNWNLVELDKEKLTVRLHQNFTDPSEISRGITQDNLVIDFNSMEFKEILDESSLRVEKSIKK